MLRILQVGLGPLGRQIAADLYARGLGRVVAAVDVAPELAGRPLSELVPGADGVTVAGELAAAAAAEVDCAVVATSSDLARCAPTLRELLARGTAVVSTCEELLWPALRHPELAAELDALARERGARLLGTGVNPGFLMDTLPALLSGACRSVRAIEAWRIQDAASRRLPFQVKIGAGLDDAAFAARVAEGRLRHVGLGESLHLLAHCAGLAIERWEESIEPVRATRDLESGVGPIPAGRAAGVRQVATGHSGGRAVARLEFVAAVGQPDPSDGVRIDGEPAIELVIRGGVHGDVATCAIVLNAIPSLLAAPPGLQTMASVPLVSHRAPGTGRAAHAAGRD